MAEIVKRLLAAEDAGLQPPDSPGDMRAVFSQLASRALPALEAGARLPVDSALALRALRVLSRRHLNRAAATERDVRLLLRVLATGAGRAADGAEDVVGVECSAVLLNLSFEEHVVSWLIGAGGVAPLTALLLSSSYAVQAAAAGALQCIAFTEPGKAAVTAQDGAIVRLVGKLSCKRADVSARALGALHNLSSSVQAASEMVSAGAVPQLIGALSTRTPGQETANAAGTLQNIARSETGRMAVIDGGGVDPLCELLISSDVTTRLAAVAALLNVLGPDIPEEGGHRSAFKHAMALCLASTAVCDAFVEEGNDDEEEEQQT